VFLTKIQTLEIPGPNSIVMAAGGGWNMPEYARLLQETEQIQVCSSV